MTKICRLCLARLQRGSKFFNINAVESFTGFMPYRDQLTTCIPEMALDLIPNPVICNSCRSALKSAYAFKSMCLLVEKKIRQYVESCDDVPGDLSDIPSEDLPPSSKLVSPQQEQEVELDEPVSEHVSEALKKDTELMVQLQRDVKLPVPGEIEIMSVAETGSTGRNRSQKKSNTNEDKDGPQVCNTCGQLFPNVGMLLLHKAIHTDEFMCNFCKKCFKSLQHLRKHNNICSKVMSKREVHPVLTKRPHLPTKAKNHLKKWLFKHTDHPYPTDQEKQMLMQETNLSLLQVENWFINARRRILQDFTKMKSYGIRIGKHTELDMDEYARSQSPPPDPPPKRKRNGSATTFEPVTLVNIKTEPNIERDPLEIITSVKCEMMDDDR